MTNSKNRLKGLILAAVMTLSAVGAPAVINTVTMTEPTAIVQTITANAATLYAPSVSGNNYIIGYCTADSNIPVYADANFKKRGAAASKYGKATYYNAYISGGSDEVKIYKSTNAYCYISYPAGKTTKYGYIKTSAVFPMNWTKNKVTSNAKVTTYKKSNLKTSYGYVAKGDTVYTVGQSGNNYKIIYNISGKNWKVSWISKSSAEQIGIIDKTYSGYVSTSSAPLILRQTASASGKQLASMPKNSTVTILDNARKTNNFYHITYNGKTGYALASYITIGTPQPPQTKLSYGLYKNNSAKITCKFDGYTTTAGRHEGIDISWAIGKPIYSLTDGVVTRVANGYRGRSGLSTIAIYVASQNKTVVYLHSAPVSSIKVGQTIKKGQQIGTQDWRGVSYASSSHTHVEVRNGKQTHAAVSVGDKTLDNPNPTSFWNAMGYTIG